MARSCESGARRSPVPTCASSEGTSRHAASHTSALNAARKKNGARHEKCAASHSPSGTPMTADNEKAAATSAVPRARRT